jgi:hypothetical protein
MLEELGMYFRSMRRYEQEPFDLTFNEESLPTPGQIALLPVKLSLGYNLMRSAWWGSKAIGMNPFSSLTNPFNPAHLKWRYRARSMKGLAARVTETAGDIAFRRIPQTFGMEGITSGDLNISRIRADKAAIGSKFIHHGPSIRDAEWTSKPWYRKVLYSRGREADIVAGEAGRLGGMGLGILDRYLIRPNEITEHMGTLHKSLRTAVSSEKLGEMMLENLYEAREFRGVKGKALSSKGFSTLSPKTSADRALMRKALEGYMKSAPISPHILLEEGMDIESMLASGTSKYSRIPVTGKMLEQYVDKLGVVDYIDTRKQFLQISRQHKISVFDIISGKGGLPKEGGVQSRWRYLQKHAAFGLDDETRRKVTLWHSTRGGARKFYQQQMLAQGKLYRDVAIEASKRVGTDVNRQLLRYYELMDSVEKGAFASQREAFKMWDRLKAPKLLKFGIGAVTAIGAASWLGKTVLERAFALPGRMAATARELMMPEFGSGEMLSNARVSTERQRAVQAIQNAHLNARYLLGNEAAMYH